MTLLDMTVLCYRLVLKCIMCADPLGVASHRKNLPARLYQLFQVVSILEKRLTPHHPRGFHNALLRAIQAIVAKPDFKITVRIQTRFSDFSRKSKYMPIFVCVYMYICT